MLENAASMSLISWRATSTNNSPSGVSVTLRVSRSNSFAPAAVSSFWIITLKADCDIWQRCAAWPKWRQSLSARKACNNLVEIFACMAIHSQKRSINRKNTLYNKISRRLHSPCNQLQCVWNRRIQTDQQESTDADFGAPPTKDTGDTHARPARLYHDRFALHGHPHQEDVTPGRAHCDPHRRGADRRLRHADLKVHRLRRDLDCTGGRHVRVRHPVLRHRHRCGHA